MHYLSPILFWTCLFGGDSDEEDSGQEQISGKDLLPKSDVTIAIKKARLDSELLANLFSETSSKPSTNKSLKEKRSQKLDRKASTAHT